MSSKAKTKSKCQRYQVSYRVSRADKRLGRIGFHGHLFTSRPWEEEATHRHLKQLITAKHYGFRLDGYAPSVRTCRRCGCTEMNCRGCIERTGRPCHWAEADLCSACAG
jgi:hypothetical protein